MIVTVVTRNSVYMIDPVANTWHRVRVSRQSGNIRTGWGRILYMDECRVGRAMRIETDPLPSTCAVSRWIITSAVIDVYFESQPVGG